MGGRLTVSSKEHCGSTFTFILPYKVSSVCDGSDDSDAISDAEDNDAAPDDTAEGFFQFQPPTLGSLFSSEGSGHTASRKLNGFSENSYSFPTDNLKSNGTTSVEDASSSVVDGPEISGSVCSSSRGSETKNENVVSRDKSQNGSSYHTEASRDHNIAVATKSSEPQQCVTISGTPEVTNPALKPKILLVEDNKINVMVTQSMMKQFGHSIDVVNNGVEAVRAVQRQSYDLILMVHFGSHTFSVLCHFSSLDSVPLHVENCGLLTLGSGYDALVPTCFRAHK